VVTSAALLGAISENLVEDTKSCQREAVPKLLVSFSTNLI